MDFNEMFKGLYQPGENDAIAEGYSPPEKFEHGEPALVMVVPKARAGGEGQNCSIYETRMPARFFTLVVEPDGDARGWSMSTGSGDGMADLIVRIAKAVSEGMLYGDS